MLHRTSDDLLLGWGVFKGITSMEDSHVVHILNITLAEVKANIEALTQEMKGV